MLLLVEYKDGSITNIIDYKVRPSRPSVISDVSLSFVGGLKAIPVMDNQLYEYCILDSMTIDYTLGEYLDLALSLGPYTNKIIGIGAMISAKNPRRDEAH